MIRSLQDRKDRYFYLWTGATSVIMLVSVIVYAKTLNPVAMIVTISVPVVFMTGYWIGNLYFQRHNVRNN